MSPELASMGHGVLVGLKWTGIVVGSLVALVVLGSLILPPLTRSHTDRWGATDAEVAMTLPGDELVPDTNQLSTKAITIEAPADTVYSLLVQMGYKRGGWYGWDWFYNMTGSSDFVGGAHATGIVPELQDLGVGDRMEINKMIGYDVLVAERPTTLLMATGFDEKGAPTALDSQAATGGMTWAWIVKDNGDGTSRLLLRTRSGGPQPSAFVDWLYDKPFDLGGAIMGYKTLVGIRDTAEKLTRN